MNSPAAHSIAHYSSAKREPILAALWRSRGLLKSLVARDLKVKYQRSALGLLWTLFNPLLMVLVYIGVFGSVLRITVDGFWAFLISGIFVWRFVSNSLGRATSILSGHAGLRRSVAFPSEVVVLSTLLTKLVEFLIEISIVLIVLFVFYHHSVPVTVILLPYLLLLQAMITLGFMFPLTVISVLYYDVEHALPVVIQLGFFLTPIFYPISMIPEAIRPYFYLNPFTGLLELFHIVLYEGVWPPWTLLGGTTAVSTLVLLAGYWVFNQSKDDCVEIA